MRFLSVLLAAALAPSVAMAQVYKCDVQQHWRDGVTDGQYDADSPRASGTTIVLDFGRGKVQQGSLPPIDGRVVSTGLNSLGILGAGKELAVFVVFPRLQDPNGGVFGTVMRVNDNEYMPKGTMMSRLSCKQQ